MENALTLAAPRSPVGVGPTDQGDDYPAWPARCDGLVGGWEGRQRPGTAGFVDGRWLWSVRLPPHSVGRPTHGAGLVCPATSPVQNPPYGTLP